VSPYTIRNSKRSHSRWLSARAFFHLLAVDFTLKTGGFHGVYDKVKSCPVSTLNADAYTVARICTAVDHARVWYPKESLCLQRSAVITRLLRREGIPALMVLAARKMPFRMHAWVEVDGVVVNDDHKVQEFYNVLEKI
jgi:hypothetical protein